MALGNSLFAGGVVTVAVFVLQQQVIDRQATERRLLTPGDLSGYDPGPRNPERGARGADGNCIESRETREKRTLLKNRYLVSRQMTGTRLDGMNLTGANLRETNLRGATLKCAILDRVSFVGADLSGANLAGADLRGADFRGASLEGATIPLRVTAWYSSKVTDDDGNPLHVAANAQTCWPPVVTRKWSEAHHLAASEMKSPVRFAASYGHTCDTSTVLVSQGKGGAFKASSVPRAPSEVQDEAALTQAITKQQAQVRTVISEIQRLTRTDDSTSQVAPETTPSPASP
jgi:hypothetical protein